MLIEPMQLLKLMLKHKVHIKGILHLGAHLCEERHVYNTVLDTKDENIIWVDALKSKCVNGVYHATISDKDNDEVSFNISNNEQSSSILDFKTHLVEHPDVVFVDCVVQKTITIDTFMETHGLDPSRYSFWNFDIQGAELLALKGAKESIKYAKAIYLEVNAAELYKGCALIDEIDHFLKAHCFKRVLTSMTGYGWGDALYIRDS
jgi:FkbM family methyltransferase